MSNNTSPSIQTLPVEILHRIFDSLDAQTILFSIRPVCRLFRAMVNTYDRYFLDFKSISKSNFHLLCRLINPQNVISLRLCDDAYTPNQIALFISLVRLRQFTRLHSITFFGIEEFQLNMILKRINLNLLNSFSLNIREYDNRRRNTTLSFLSSILTQSNLRNVELNIRNDRISSTLWPATSRIEYLIIDSDISFHSIFTILSCSPQLHTLILKQNSPTLIENMKQKYSFPQLISLTIENLDVNIDQLESFVFLMPSLIYLKLIGQQYVFDGKRWEQFIQISLPNLNNFEFFIDISNSISQTQENLQLIIDSFRSPFWIEYKKWFVACQYTPSYPYTTQIYSIPICKSIVQYDVNSKIINLSNSTTFLTYDPLTIKNINEIVLSLGSSTYENTREKSSRINVMFSNVTKIHVKLDNKPPLDSLEVLTKVIDVSKLVEVKLQIRYFKQDIQNLLFEIISFLEQAYSLSSLIFYGNYYKGELYPYVKHICSIIPRQIKHLQIPINQLDQIEAILERCQNLSVIQFEITRLKFSQEVVDWFNQHTIDSTIQKHARCNIIWIGKKINHITDNHKRIKLDENQLDS
ncbi:unnamed protein product [Rotaria sp. Silwood1]|nr:unnamed protein product [Rotaria sp. Silwood1]CAF3498514.1 unnamed protein product [Rotaria sp. Silwood1]CAF3601562.1 unnamed protein product [Rotaria sp. Silwood1]CAF4632118.1 unnamed protein product [Rotaria sp. Silwood1]CAF4707882.1 unnamed protein product [Rotaria sp. Silwood1]